MPGYTRARSIDRLLALAAALALIAVTALPADAQRSSGRTGTQTYHPGEPHTDRPGGAPGRSSGRTGTQNPFGPVTAAPPAAPPVPPPRPHQPTLEEMVARIDTFWDGVFRRCNFPTYEPPFGVYTLAPVDIVRDIMNGLAMVPPRPNGALAFSTRTAFYVASFQPMPSPLIGAIIVNEANVYREDPRQPRSALSVLDPYLLAEIRLAHEVGHRVQDQLGTMVATFPPGQATPVTRRREEIEADAFAGAYVNWLDSQGELPLGMITAGNLSRKRAGDDARGVARTSMETHGTSHERATAFMKGVTLGLPDDFCRTRIAVR